MLTETLLTETRFITRTVGVVICGIVMGAPLPDLRGQEPQSLGAHPNVEESLECFQRSMAKGKHWSEGCGPNVVKVETIVITRPEKYAGIREQVLDGLARLAVGADNADVQRGALSTLINAGSLSKEVGTEAEARVADRLSRIYGQLESPFLQNRLVMGLLELNARDQAIVLLEDIARTDSPEQRGAETPTPRLAIATLAEMGSEGMSALRRLAAQEAVRNPSARRYLKYVLERRNMQPPMN